MKLIRFLLFPFAILYRLIMALRNLFYDEGIFNSTSFDIPVIAVGNLNMGGTGKSPQIEYLIRLLQTNKKVAVLSRGYKRKTSGFVLINETHSVLDVGDEPLQFYKKFPNIHVAVDANRVNGIERLKREVNPDIILLDDAFQHRKVKADFYVLLTKYGDLFTRDYVLPRGNLRESRKGAKRADLVIVTKCPKDLSFEAQEHIKRKIAKYSDKPIFFSGISYDNEIKGTTKVSASELKDHELIVVTGIANPKPFLDHLSALDCTFEHFNYPDHHNFSKEDIRQIKNAYNGIQSVEKILLTTEKDYMRLSEHVTALSYLEIKSVFLSGKEDFDKSILEVASPSLPQVSVDLLDQTED